ncbi:hypothetical protein [Jeotgalibacillus proteolyticus]|uniref:Uncharacterized protein n=1 Tax=Jeotgalibacillus proteolyticus TaxID=2082395 RepID=A0A2S5GGZ3_9BACL|nr:hypothetical protein [Jeotgalibacillus proteolyticus]PPA72194.1 hypothetical protein C4B60_02115 [Jeotgalibacillus proteolyticus]
MKQVIQVTRKRDLKSERMAILRLELDYELAVLFEAMEEQNVSSMDVSKEKLSGIRKELIELKGGV